MWGRALAALGIRFTAPCICTVSLFFGYNKSKGSVYDLNIGAGLTNMEVSDWQLPHAGLTPGTNQELHARN